MHTQQTTRRITHRASLREDAIARARLAVRLAEIGGIDDICLQMTHAGYEWLDDNGYLVTLSRDGFIQDVRL